MEDLQASSHSMIPLIYHNFSTVGKNIVCEEGLSDMTNVREKNVKSKSLSALSKINVVCTHP
jgi:hypothetical protein